MLVYEMRRRLKNIVVVLLRFLEVAVVLALIVLVRASGPGSSEIERAAYNRMGRV